MKSKELDSEQFYKSMIDGLDVAMHVADRKLTIVSCNRAIEKLSNGRITPKDVIGKNIFKAFDFLGPKVRREYSTVIRKKRVVITEELNELGGEKIYTETRKVPIMDERGRVSNIVTVIRDITARKHGALELEAAKERYQKLFELSPDGIAVFQDLRIVAANKAGMKMLGYNKISEAIGKPALSFVHPGYRKIALARIKHAIETRKPSRLLEEKFRKKDGSYVPVEVVNSPMTWGGRPAIQVVFRDILKRKTIESELEGYRSHLEDVVRKRTEQLVKMNTILREDISKREKAEDELLRIRNQQKAILNNIPDIAWLKDMKSRFIAVNKPFARACGYEDPEKLVGKTDLDVWPRKLARGYRADDGEVMRSGKRKIVDEPLADKHGRVSWIETIKTPIRDYKGIVVGTAGIARDITERKKVSEELDRYRNRLEELVAERTKEVTEINKELAEDVIERRRSENELRQIFDFAPTFIWKYCPSKDKFIYASRLMTKLSGIPREAFLRNHHIWNRRVDRGKESQEAIKTALKAIKAGKPYRVEYLFHTLHRGARWFNIEARPSREGGTLYYYGKTTDVTERRTAEDNLKSSERFLSSIFSSIQDGISILNKDMTIRSVNKTMEKWYAHNMPLVGKKCYKAYHNCNKQCKICPSRKTLKTGKAAYEIVPKVGPSKKVTGWLALYSFPLIDTHTRRTTGVIEYVRDITEQKMVEDALRDSEEKFRSLAEQSPNMIFINAMGRVVYANRKCEEVMGYSREEFYSPKFEFIKLCPHEYKPVIKEKFRMHLRGKDVAPYEYEILTKNGLRINSILTTKLINYGGERAILGTITDVSPLKEAEKELRDVKDHLQTVLDGIDESIVVIDRKYRIISHNRAFTESLRKKRKNVVGMHCFRVIHGYLKPCRNCVLRNAFKTKKLEHDVHYHLEKGHRIYHETKAYPLKDDTGKVQQCIYVFRDVTARESAYEMCKIANEQLEGLNRMKSEFISISSHELRTPISIIKGYVDIMREGMLGPVNDKQLEKLENISRNINHLDRLVDETMDLSRIDAGELKLEKRRIDLRSLVTSVADDFWSKAGDMLIQIKVRVPKDPVTATVDYGRIKQVVNNLVDNAIKFTPYGGSVELAVRRNVDKVVIEVRDTGIGIPKGSIDKVFDRFYQADSSHKRGYKGVGLGLSICKSIVELHGGSIKIISKLGNGTTVIVKLPA
ncbi:MAG: PAS domain S-box protein [Candidatus Altiarchaeota archaeon]|nr:PAS domain S-box protein [Candidatus Altiarchaeota archaeon]